MTVLPEMEKLMKECVGVQLGEDGAIIVVNEEAEWIIVSVDQKAHKSNEAASW